jgi:hypothetical protein
MVYSNYPQYFEKRESPRISWTNSEVQVMIISSNTKFKVLGWLQDISHGGFKLKAGNSLTFNDFLQGWAEIYFETFEDFFQLKGQGRVIWTSSNDNMVGIRIDHLDEESRRHLYGFLGILPMD